MSEPRDPNRYFKLLDLLLERTKLGDIQWREEDDTPYAYTFRGTSAGVRIESRDRDGRFPVRFVILDSRNEPVESYVTFEDSPDPSEVFWDDRVRALWEVVGPKHEDPVGSLLGELQDLPHW